MEKIYPTLSYAFKESENLKRLLPAHRASKTDHPQSLFLRCLSLRRIFFLLCVLIFLLFLFLPQGMLTPFLLLYQFIQRIFNNPFCSSLFKLRDDLTNKLFLDHRLNRHPLFVRETGNRRFS